jgi:hypothetical protein
MQKITVLFLLLLCLALPAFPLADSGFNHADNNFTVQVNSSECWRMTTTCNLGIGTSVPGQSLTVNGTIEALSNGFLFPDGSRQTTASGGTFPNVQSFTGNGTWTKPNGATLVRVVVVGAGGGGGSGRRGAAASNRAGGAGGGGGGWIAGEFLATDLPSTVAVTIGTGGAGGAAVSSNDTNGNNGSTGGNTTFGTYLLGPGGGGGGGGATTSSTGGTGGAITPLTSNSGLQGISGMDGKAGTNSTSATGNTGFSQPTGGSAGGGINSSDTVASGLIGPQITGGSTSRLGTTCTGGAANGGTGSSCLSGILYKVGTGGGGGTASKTATASSGGTGGNYGGGGGGGGASLNGFNSGAGGAGGPGQAIVVSW